MNREKMNLSPIKNRIRRENFSLTPEERMTKFANLQKQSFEMMSDEGRKRFIARNHKKRAVN